MLPGLAGKDLVITRHLPQNISIPRALYLVEHFCQGWLNFSTYTRSLLAPTLATNSYAFQLKQCSVVAGLGLIAFLTASVDCRARLRFEWPVT